MDNVRTKGHYVFCTFITRKDGSRIYARDYGKKAFRIFIED